MRQKSQKDLDFAAEGIIVVWLQDDSFPYSGETGAALKCQDQPHSPVVQQSPSPRKRTQIQKRVELVLESLLWRFRLVAIVPVVMSLASTLLTFAIGTRDISRSIQAYLSHAQDDHGDHLALAGVVSGIDFYLIGVALLIFGYGIYELLISEIDVYRDQTATGESGGLLDIRNLDQLKEKLVKVLVVALIVSAFKSMISIPVKDVTSMIYFCFGVLILALSGFLIAYNPAGKPKH